MDAISCGASVRRVRTRDRLAIICTCRSQCSPFPPFGPSALGGFRLGREMRSQWSRCSFCRSICFLTREACEPRLTRLLYSNHGSNSHTREIVSSPVVTGEGDREAVVGATAGRRSVALGPLRLPGIAAGVGTSPATAGEESLMARSTPSFVCQSCGAAASKWSGKCESCGGWNTITEEGAPAPIGAGAARRVRGRKFALEDLKTEDEAPPRRVTGVAEFDRVAGGGIVPGSALLIGGDPGVGKSTLILQALASFAARGGRAVYISGEEAMAQVRLRAARMGLSDSPVALGAATNIEDILATLESAQRPDIVAIDSIQTIWTGALEAAPGTIAQVRTASFDLVRYAKASGAAVILVGHVTKDGQIAGPKAVEHLVDAVLYFEGERGHHFRVLRAVKNRFGPTDEIGVFEMTGKGLAEVANPSALFLGDRNSTS